MNHTFSFIKHHTFLPIFHLSRARRLDQPANSECSEIDMILHQRHCLIVLNLYVVFDGRDRAAGTWTWASAEAHECFLSSTLKRPWIFLISISPGRANSSDLLQLLLRNSSYVSHTLKQNSMDDKRNRLQLNSIFILLTLCVIVFVWQSQCKSQSCTSTQISENEGPALLK